MPKKKKPELYNKYLQQTEADQTKQEIEKRFGEEVVVKKVSTAAEILRMIEDFLGKLFKGFLWMTIVVLCSIAVTVLLNESTRNAFLNILPF